MLAEGEAVLETVGVGDPLEEHTQVLEDVAVQERVPVGGVDRETVWDRERLSVGVAR